MLTPPSIIEYLNDMYQCLTTDMNTNFYRQVDTYHLRFTESTILIEVLIPMEWVIIRLVSAWYFKLCFHFTLVSIYGILCPHTPDCFPLLSSFKLHFNTITLQQSSQKKKLPIAYTFLHALKRNISFNLACIHLHAAMWNMCNIIELDWFHSQTRGSCNVHHITRVNSYRAIINSISLVLLMFDMEFVIPQYYLFFVLPHFCL